MSLQAFSNAARSHLAPCSAARVQTITGAIRSSAATSVSVRCNLCEF